MKLAAITAAVMLMAAAIFPTMLPEKMKQKIEDAEKYFSVNAPFDFNKELGDGKAAFPIIKDMLNEPIENFDELNSLVDKILEFKYNPFPRGKPLKKAKVIKRIKGKPGKALKAAAALDQYFALHYSALSDEEKAALGSNEDIPTEEIFSIYEEAGFKGAFYRFNKMIRLLNEIDWDAVEEIDIPGYFFVGVPNGNTLSDYLIVVDRSDKPVEFEKAVGKVRIYIKTGRCEKVTSEPACAMMGASVFLELSGSDTFYKGNAQGNAVLGFSYLLDSGGDDIYRSGEFSQAAAQFGAAYLIDLEGNDIYSATRYSQAAAFTAGLAVLDDRKGNDSYIIEKRFLHEPLYNDRYQSLSQGFSIGDRGKGFAGGIALLSDREGNDHYSAEVYAQGAGYWFSLGMLWDRAGNDNYTAHIYGQGSGIHLATGILSDGGGADTYTLLDGVGMGGGHDLAVGILCDSGDGNDAFQGSGITMGAGHANGVGIFFNEAGNDSYAGVKILIIGDGSLSRDTASFGLFIDGKGDDTYTDSQAKNEDIWIRGFLGVGIDE